MKQVILFSALIAATLSAAAQTRTPVIHERQQRQQQRIANGVKSGQLTARETARLENRETKLQQDKRLAKSDGVVTHQERQELRREENRDSRAIYEQKHDANIRH
ncbi:MAG TPA: hypothetical protein VM802_05205 [Chitinophaga sp.]|uniref:hypothetical protein n=1 Tax=Chitinophaga sp. TaxID=1869181 RepID=UPI002C86C6D0|nr:hypothetical protein [Chitinophaga sp.]HVI44240.1 hypothetical protein [Chitinophaga sp.]